MVLRNILLDLLRLPRSNPRLAIAQFKAFSRQLPLMYAILLLNTGFLAISFYNVAPDWLTLFVPIVMFTACTMRLSRWWRLRDQLISGDVALGELHRTVVLAPILGSAFTGWALTLFPYGDAFRQAHVAFYMAITVIGCIFCLMQLRSAAVLVVASVLIPFTIFFMLSGNAVFVAIAANMVLVAGAMTFVLLSQYRTFADLVDTQGLLEARNDETQRLSDHNQILANVDSLTELPNRRCFFIELERRIKAAEAGAGGFALGLIDLDGFKPVNDLYGHATGDRVLKETGQRLRDTCGEGVFIARLGGDEFALLAESHAKLNPEGDMLRLGRRICTALQEPFWNHEVVAQISCSLGFGIWGEAGADAAELYENADYALYQAKQKLRGEPVVFNQAHKSELREISLVEQTLRVCDLDAEMRLQFQPVVDVAANRVCGFEALARWESSVLGPVEPVLFIRAAERCGLINKLTPILLRKVLADMQGLPATVRVAFNLSARDLNSAETILRLVSIVRESGVDPKRLDFEITETAILGDFEQTCDALRMLRQIGSRIALDDFGSGFSSLSHVHRLPLDSLKIDRSFVADIETNANSRNIVHSVADLARNLGVGCIVEGVERETQVAILREFGLTIMQGYYFGVPASVGVAMKALQQEQAAA